MAVLSVADLAAYYEGDLPARPDWLSMLIGRAERRLEQLVPGVTLAVASGAVDADLYLDAVAEAVLRVVRNPSNTRTRTLTDGPHSRSETSGWDSAGEGLFFTDAELAGLTPGATGDAFEIRLG